MLEQLQGMMCEVYRSFAYLLKSDALIDAERKFMESIIVGTASEVDLQRSLVNLTHYLKAHHGKSVLLLIDEYDAPI